MTLGHPSRPTRRSFLSSGVTLASTFQLQRAAHALGLAVGSDVCQLAPEQEVGPYYIADELLRSDIVEGKPGVPLRLRLVALDARTCAPLRNAAIEIWHCDALGLYSGFTAQNPMGPGGPGPGGRPHGPPPGTDRSFDPQHPGNRPGPPERMGPPLMNAPSDKLTFLRGIQLTGPDGAVTFQTVFPGFYMGRTNHIHFKVRLGGHPDNRTYLAGHTAHTGQVFFPEAISLALMQHEPYSRHGIHRTTQREDDIFGEQHGALSVAKLRAIKGSDLHAGLEADLVAAVDPSATPAPAQRTGGPPPPR